MSPAFRFIFEPQKKVSNNVNNKPPARQPTQHERPPTTSHQPTPPNSITSLSNKSVTPVTTQKAEIITKIEQEAKTPLANIKIKSEVEDDEVIDILGNS